MGPDEYHEYDPSRPAEQGLRNNAYTNMMVVWCLDKAVSEIKYLIDWLFKQTFSKNLAFH